MPGLGEVKEFGSWLVEAYGTVSSLLIFAIIYLVYQLRNEQKENSAIYAQMTSLLEKSVKTQILYADSLRELTNAIERKDKA